MITVHGAKGSGSVPIEATLACRTNRCDGSALYGRDLLGTALAFLK